MITIRSPSFKIPSSIALVTAWSKSESLSLISSDFIGITPHERLSWRCALSLVVAAIIGQVGRNFDNVLAVRPPFVTVSIAVAPRSIEVVTVACAIAFVTFGTPSFSLEKKRLR